jgi:isopenicillin-N N-acyltransferase-like protein
MIHVARRSWWRRHARTLTAAAGACALALPPVAHEAIGFATRIAPPAVTLPPAAQTRSWTRVRAGLREVYLQGTPEAIGAEHARLLRERMVADEAALWGDFARYVPWWLARVGIQDVSRIRYRHVDANIPEPRRRELAAEALAFAPDPFISHMPTYQRLMFLHALYDIALQFERSPLLGCTSFAIDPSRTADGHVLAARAFDFEGGDAFDLDKAVFLVREDGAVPFASVAWPGFVGVVTGVNAEGLMLVVHGARAAEPSTTGLPVAFSLRQALEHAHDTDEAVAILRAQPVMVSHIVFAADAQGRFAVVERAPGVEAFVRETRAAVGVTNHFEGPLAADPKNLRVRASTTTLARKRRVDELLARIAPRGATVESALAILRDHGCADDEHCPPGDRRAIDALIATHGVVADLTDRVLWVSAGPHLSGHFVRLDLRTLLSADHDPDTDPQPPTMPDDPILHDGRYAAGRARAGAPKIGGGRGP